MRILARCMADYQTVLEKKGRLERHQNRLYWRWQQYGALPDDGCEQAWAWISRLLRQKAMTPDKEVDSAIQGECSRNRREPACYARSTEAIENADIVYTDVWASMGFEAEQKEREIAFKNYPSQRSSCEICEAGLLVHALLACTPRGRSERGRYRRRAFDYFRPSRESSSCAKGYYGRDQ